MSDIDILAIGGVGGRPEMALPESGRRVAAASSTDTIGSRYMEVRQFTEYLTEGLAPEDMVVQSMPDASPTKWHLAHTSWFFEQFLLSPHLPGYKPLDPVYLYLFNSYYHQAGERHCRDQRGYISRPTVAEVMAYREHVDEAIMDLIGGLDPGEDGEIVDLLTLGLHHEQQHQELVLTDIKHLFSVNPLRPSFRDQGGRVWADSGGTGATKELGWIEIEGGVHAIGDDGVGFAYDNEGPRHRQFIEAHAIADRLVTVGEYLEFMDDGGYQRPELWLSMGWAAVQSQGWTEPFYWERLDDDWRVFTLSGLRELDQSEPICHLNYFEADAYARWAGARLPTEAEWEIAAVGVPIVGNFIERGALHPLRLGETIGAASDPEVDDVGPPPLTGLATFGAAEPAALRVLGTASHDGGASDPNDGGVASGSEATGGLVPGPHQLYGDLWEWTSSPYTAYPGFRPAAGAVGEYNGKFMCNQFVLRGGSCATSRSHIRPTYRNFFPPDASWQFTGLRLARDAR